jgi:apolipoprotein N-acyltransferase
MGGSALQLLGIFILHLLLSLFSGLCFFVVGFSCTKKITINYRPLIFGSSLVLAEVLRSLVISLLYYGNNTTIDLHFTAGTLGNALAPTPFIEYAYFGGTFTLTFILGYFIYIVVSKKHILQYWKHGALLCVTLIGIHFLVPTYGPSTTTTVGIITTNFRTTKDSDALVAFKQQNKQVHDMTLSLETSHPHIIVYPEDTRYLAHLKNGDEILLSSTFPGTLFIDGDTRMFNSELTNVSLFYVPGSKKATARGKSFLLPFNEYLPYVFKDIFSFFVTIENLDTYIKNHTYTPVYSNKTVLFEGVRVGTLLCSEIISYRTIQNLREENPSLVFFQSRLNVFHDNPWFKAHLYSFTKIAAAQLRRPLISSTNNAPSFVISPYGKILKTIPTGFSTSTYTFYK